MGGGLEDGDDMGRSWLRPLLKTDFFMPCLLHADARKSKCNMYCLECTGSPMCTNCLDDHREHHVVQIRRATRHSAIQRHKNVGGVQLDRHLLRADLHNKQCQGCLLNSRSQERHGKGVANTCESCGPLLLDASSRFCSLGCKLGDIKDVPGQIFALHPKPG